VREAESYKRSGMNYLILGIVRLREALGQVRRFKDEVASTMA
jgi:hypothetical protein